MCSFVFDTQWKSSIPEVEIIKDAEDLLQINTRADDIRQL